MYKLLLYDIKKKKKTNIPRRKYYLEFFEAAWQRTTSILIPIIYAIVYLRKFRSCSL